LTFRYPQRAGLRRFQLAKASPLASLDFMSTITNHFSPSARNDKLGFLFRGTLAILLSCCLLLFVMPAAHAQSRKVVAIAHRGEHLHNPENTIQAFQEAIRVGADFFELDVQTTSDDKLVPERKRQRPAPSLWFVLIGGCECCRDD
jgi:hypothetical protein